MRLYWDLDLGYLVRTPGTDTKLREIEFKRGDATTLELSFYRNGAAVLLDADFEVRFAIKEKGKYDDGPVVFTNEFSQDAENKIYKARPSLNTEQLNDLLGMDPPQTNNDLPRVECIAELSYRIGLTSEEWLSTQTLKAWINNDVIRGGEGTPTEAANPENYLTEDRVIEYLREVVGLTGGGSTKLDGVVTVGSDPGWLVALVDESQNPPLVRIYELVIGIDAESAPDLIRPDDFAVETNGRVWKLRNTGGGVRYDAAQSLDNAQKAQARANIGAAAELGGIEYLADVVGLTGGGFTKLDGIATTGFSDGKLVALVDDTASVSGPGFPDRPYLRIYELVAGNTDPEIPPDTIRPDDHGAGNVKTWKVRNIACSIRYDLGQSLNTGQQAVARSNIGAVAETRQIATQHSLQGGGNLSTDRALSLVGDVASPGALKVYGTNAAGARGWYDTSFTTVNTPGIAFIQKTENGGSDVTGLINRPDRPFATFAAAYLAVVASGHDLSKSWTYAFGPGHHASLVITETPQFRARLMAWGAAGGNWTTWTGVTINLIQVYGANGSPADAYNPATPGGDTFVEIEGDGCITVYGIAAGGGQGGPATETEPAMRGGSAALSLRNIRCKEVGVAIGPLGAGEIPTSGTASALFRGERSHFGSVVLVTAENMNPAVTAEDVQVHWCLIDNGITFEGPEWPDTARGYIHHSEVGSADAHLVQRNTIDWSAL